MMINLQRQEKSHWPEHGTESTQADSEGAPSICRILT